MNIKFKNGFMKVNDSVPVAMIVRGSGYYEANPFWGDKQSQKFNTEKEAEAWLVVLYRFTH